METGGRNKERLWMRTLLVTLNLPNIGGGNPTWKESLAGLRGAIGLRVLQKWMLGGNELGVSSTGVCGDGVAGTQVNR